MRKLSKDININGVLEAIKQEVELMTKENWEAPLLTVSSGLSLDILMSNLRALHICLHKWNLFRDNEEVVKMLYFKATILFAWFWAIGLDKDTLNSWLYPTDVDDVISELREHLVSIFPKTAIQELIPPEVLPSFLNVTVVRQTHTLLLFGTSFEEVLYTCRVGGTTIFPYAPCIFKD